MIDNIRSGSARWLNIVIIDRAITESGYKIEFLGVGLDWPATVNEWGL